VSGDLYTPGQVASVPGQRAGKNGSPQGSGLTERLRGYWLSNPGKVMLLATVLALAIRLFTLTRPGYLTGITEYDDGVYLGGSIRLSEGQLPYLNFATVQPPGIFELLLPVALFAKVTTTVKGLALARLLTVAASTACIPLAGNLVRYRGTVVTAVTCGILAVYPPDITTAHTLLLEPWMNLFCLLAINVAFRRGHLARPRMLLWAGILLGFACTIKFWSGAPALVLLVLCLVVSTDRWQRVRNYVIGLVVGFVAPSSPFLVLTPMAFIRSTVFDQADRQGSPVALGIRLANLTGLIDIYNDHGTLSFNAGAHSMYAAGAAASIGDSNTLGLLPFIATFLLAVAIALGYWFQSRWLTQLEWLALATAVIAAAAVTGYSAFFYHYADFPAPWLALTVGSAAGALAGRSVKFSMIVLRVFAVFIVLVAVLQVREIYPMRQSTAQNMAALIPPGACVVTDEVSLTIAADRFTSLPPGCPDIIDSLAVTLVAGNGESVQGGAANNPAVVALWKKYLNAAQYVWLSPAHGSRRRITWTTGLSDWFNANFVPVSQYAGGTGQLYKHVTSATTAP
jgi:alpha-1,2-mannosyltransferase